MLTHFLCQTLSSHWQNSSVVQRKHGVRFSSFDLVFVLMFFLYQCAEFIPNLRLQSFRNGEAFWHAASKADTQIVRQLSPVPLEGIVLTVGLLASAPCHWERFKCIVVTTAFLLYDRQSQIFTVKTFGHCRIMEKLFTSHGSEMSLRFLCNSNNQIIIVFWRQCLI